jgi:hypothetical protein
LPELDRRELLADLGTRLRAMLQHLGDRGMPPARLVRLRALVGRLDEVAVLALARDEFARLWSDTLAELTAIAAS